jgi:hypothetical protein
VVGALTVEAVRPDAERIAYIVRNLRPRDREEIFALRWDDDEEEFVREVISYAGDMSWVWEWNGMPVAIQGSAPRRPGVWTNWCFGTDNWDRALFAMTRHARKFIMPALLAARFHRAEALSLASHQDARGWIEMLGGKVESIMRGLGREGQDYAVYRWSPDDVRRWGTESR